MFGLGAGRADVTEAANRSNNIAEMAKNRGLRDRQRTNAYASHIDPFAESLIPTGGGLSPYAAATLDRQKRDIGRTYSDLASVAQRGLASRGMGSAPSGLAASLYNTNARNAGEAESNAYSDAMERTLEGGLQGSKILQGQEDFFDPNKDFSLALQGDKAATDSAVARSKMGSGLGDVLKGIGGGLSLFSGLGGLSGIGKLFGGAKTAAAI